MHCGQMSRFNKTSSDVFADVMISRTTILQTHQVVKLVASTENLCVSLSAEFRILHLRIPKIRLFRKPKLANSENCTLLKNTRSTVTYIMRQHRWGILYVTLVVLKSIFVVSNRKYTIRGGGCHLTRTRKLVLGAPTKGLAPGPHKLVPVLCTCSTLK